MSCIHFEKTFLKRGQLSQWYTPPIAKVFSFQDHRDRRLKSFAKYSFKAARSALWPMFASSWISRATFEWARQLCQCIVFGSLFEPFLDAGRFLVCSSSLSGAICKTLWLKCWSADAASKMSLAAFSFRSFWCCSSPHPSLRKHSPQDQIEKPFFTPRPY